MIQAQSHTPWEFEQSLADHLDGLLDDATMDGAVMTLGLQAEYRAVRDLGLECHLGWLVRCQQCG